MQTFEENKPARVEYDPLNQCRRCGIRAGRYQNKETKEFVGVYLLNDKRGVKICNLCANEGHLIREPKMTKKEKKHFKKMKQEVMKVAHLKHITLNSKGEVVT